MGASTSTERLRWLLTLVILGVVGFGLVRWWRVGSSNDATVLIPSDDMPETAVVDIAAPDMNLIGVDVVGAVRHPGLYYLPPGARVDDAIRSAGGFAPDANRDAVNLAARVRDEEQLRVPRVGDTRLAPVLEPVVDELVVAPPDESTVEQQSPQPEPQQPALLNLNTADLAALERLPEIGPVTAQRILDYRAANGPFHDIQQLDNVAGIGAATIHALRNLVTVEP